MVPYRIQPMQQRTAKQDATVCLFALSSNQPFLLASPESGQLVTDMKWLLEPFKDH